MTRERGWKPRLGVMGTERLPRTSTELTIRPAPLFGAVLLDIARCDDRGPELAGVPAGRDVLHKSADVAWLHETEGASASFVEGGLAGGLALRRKVTRVEPSWQRFGIGLAPHGDSCRWRHLGTGGSPPTTRERSERSRRSSERLGPPGFRRAGRRDGMSEGPVASAACGRERRTRSRNHPPKAGSFAVVREESVGEFQA